LEAEKVKNRVHAIGNVQHKDLTHTIQLGVHEETERSTAKDSHSRS